MCKCLMELRRTIREILKDMPEKISHGDHFDYLRHYDGVVDLDFGEMCPILSVFQPSDILEARKAANIDDIESTLKEGTAGSAYAKYQVYLRQPKANDNGLSLWNFYSSRVVCRWTWDNAISQRSCLDKVCNFIINQANSIFAMSQQIHPERIIQRIDRPLYMASAWMQ
ncbi:hypothetical protein VTP01DRAFT_949 [Rhizomucor pusillus]|uniref:uncharacterized protein n=1 Tax=Rhizomucor pusillus TaxID=4840 RepID=UPI00374357D5